MTGHDSTVLVLGAGFSAAAGHPLMADFARIVTGLATDNQTALREEERARFRSVLNFRSDLRKLYAYLNLDLDNLEHLFGLVDMESSLSGSSPTGLLRDDLIFVLVKTLELTLATVPEVESQVEPYRMAGDRPTFRRHRGRTHPFVAYVDFANSLRPHDVVLTFNYDTVLEDALLRAEVGPHYGFEDPAWPQVTRTQTVLKLHGSVNFVEQADGHVEVVDFELLKETTERYYERGNPLLIPPTWNKPSPSGVIQRIWTLAGEALSKASRLVFIGYSLPETDLSFRYLLASCLANNEILESVSVLDPDPATRDRYRRFVSEALRNQQKFHPIDNVFQNAWRQALGID